MAYRHYETEGLIISHRNLGEANRLYQVLTLDFGLINVLAQSVRRDRSKLRHHLENFSFVNLVLVHGREFWRVVGVDDLGLLARPAKEAFPFFKKISLVLQRLIQGEETNPLIYQDLKQALVLILEKEQRSRANLSTLEIFVLVRLLTQLGYLAPPAELKSILSLQIFSWADIEKIEGFKSLLVRQINEALEITQL